MAQDIVKQLHKLLIKKEKTIAVAESCTGGHLSSLLTDISGSSRYFLLGVTSYSNQAKETILRIPRAILTRHGAVSKAVASMMAKNVKKIAKTDLGIGITGIAGPTGGTPQKPIGTVFVALNSKGKKICERFLFKGSRTSIRKQAALKALKLLKTII